MKRRLKTYKCASKQSVSLNGAVNQKVCETCFQTAGPVIFSGGDFFIRHMPNLCDDVLETDGSEGLTSKKMKLRKHLTPC